MDRWGTAGTNSPLRAGSESQAGLYTRGKHEQGTFRPYREAEGGGGAGALPATNVVIELFRDLVLRVRDQTPGLVPADEEPAFSLSLSSSRRIPNYRSPPYKLESSELRTRVSGVSSSRLRRDLDAHPRRYSGEGSCAIRDP